MKLILILRSALFAATIFSAPNAKYGAKRPVHQTISNGELQRPRNSIFRRQQTTSNWAGAVIYPTSGEQFQSVSATFYVPGPGSPGTSVLIGIGIDGAMNDSTVSIQITLALMVDSDGTGDYIFAYMWYPDPSVYIGQDQFSFIAGDELYFLLVAYANSANLYIKNINSGQVFELLFQPSNPNNVVLGQSAEWIAQTTSADNLMNFGTVTFSLCNVTNTFMQDQDLSGALSITMIDSQGFAIASGSISDPSTLKITYNGT